VECHRPSDVAVRLANDIYFTYLQLDDNAFRIPMQRLGEILGESDLVLVKREVVAIFEELNEPICLDGYFYRGKKLPWQLVNFFEYRFDFDEGEVFVEIEISELYLNALENMLPESYINFQ